MVHLSMKEPNFLNSQDDRFSRKFRDDQLRSGNLITKLRPLCAENPFSVAVLGFDLRSNFQPAGFKISPSFAISSGRGLEVGVFVLMICFIGLDETKNIRLGKVPNLF